MTDAHETAVPRRTVKMQIVNAFIRNGADGNPAGLAGGILGYEPHDRTC